MKYNWRTHEWKVGDRCVWRPRDSDPVKDRVVSKVRNDGYLEINGWHGLYHRSECIPLRKKPKAPLREFWLRKTMLGEQPIWQIDRLPGEMNKGACETIRVREVRP
jgi:hypothetical protein